MSNQSDLAKSAAGFNGDPLSIDTANNRVGIGTSSPVSKLDLASGNITISNSTNAPYINFVENTTRSQSLARITMDQVSGTAGQLLFSTTTGGTLSERMRIDSSGNVGIGCVPSSIQSGFDTLQIGGNLTLNVDSTGAGAGAYMGNNVYRDSGDSRWEYIYTDEASQYLQANGEHIWRYAGSGTANTAITWSEAMRIDSSGNLLVGTTSTGGGRCVLETTSTNQLVLSNKDTGADAQYAAYFLRNNSIVGSIQTSNTSSSFVSSSDYRLKENVTDVTDGITRVKQLEPKRFNFIADPDRTVDGFLAHEAQAVVPEAVTGTHNEVDDDGNAVMQGIDQSKLVPLLTAALKEAITKIEALEARVTALEGN